MPMGVLAPGSAHAQPPIDMSGNFQAHMSVESPSNISLHPSEVISVVLEPNQKERKRTTFENTPFGLPKYSIVLGEGLVPIFVRHGILSSYYFCYLGSHEKFQNLNWTNCLVI